jgi:Taurine catabolism dioxygenase TauD, TfdA family
VEAAEKLPGIPRLTAAQDEALDLHAEVCEELAFTMELQPGDLQLLNNHVVYHGRTAYEDADGPDRDQLLLRLWISPPNSRALPPGLRDALGHDGARRPARRHRLARLTGQEAGCPCPARRRRRAGGVVVRHEANASSRRAVRAARSVRKGPRNLLSQCGP